jgi:hypothetical protein
MIKNLFNKITKNTPVDRVHKEFKTLMNLSNKFYDLKAKCSTTDNEIYAEQIETQREILINNFRTIGHVYNSLGYPKHPFKDDDFLSIQGTPAKVFESKHDIDENIKIYNKILDISTSTHILNDKDIFLDSKLDINIKFLDLDDKRINNKKLKKIKAKTEQKLIYEIIKFSEDFVDNEELIKNYIFSNLEGEFDHYHNILDMFKRLNFVYSIYTQLGPNILSKDFDFCQKDLVYIKLQQFHLSNDNKVAEFLSNFKQYRYDFLIQK